jgi:hypothetical protein
MSDTGDSHAAGDELLPDEPHTPLWLTLLGAALGLLAVIYFVATRPEAKTTDQLRQGAAPPAAASGAEPAAPAAAPAPPGQIPARPMLAPPGPAPGAEPRPAVIRPVRPPPRPAPNGR